MGCGHSKELTHRRQAGPHPPPLCAAEIAATQKRRVKCRQALLDFLTTAHPQLAEELKKHVTVGSEGDPFNRAPDALPRIGLVVSGGGWRAMMAATAAADELSRIGILDTVEIAAGLSGSSWFVQNWALGGSDKNVFHETTDHHPWAHKERFDPAVHRYQGLIHMLSQKVVHRSAQIPKHLEIFGKFAEFVTNSDLTFFRLLLLSSGGDSMISRYASFLDQQLLIWQSAEERKNDLLLQNALSAKAIDDGTFPVLAVAAIDTVTRDDQTPNAQAGKSKNVWTEFTPYGARSRNVDFGATQAIPSAHVKFDGHKVPLTAGRLMGVCGSAFAVDTEQLLGGMPKALSRLAKLFGVKENESNVILKDTLTKTYVTMPKRGQQGTAPRDMETEEVLFGQLRDAGLDFNVPFPLVLKQSSGRTLDIVIAIDAGQGATGANTLATAVEYGYIEIEGQTAASLKDAFPDGERVRVFYPPIDATTGQRSGPVIVYVVVLNTTKSWKIAYTREEVIACTSFVRQTVRDQVALEVIRALQKYTLDQLQSTGKIDAERRKELDGDGGVNQSPFLSGSGVVLDPAGATDAFCELTVIALRRLVQDPTINTLHLNPLDVVQSIEREVIDHIPQALRARAVQRVAELVAAADVRNVITLTLSDPLDEIDSALVGSKWIAKIDNEYKFADETLFDYALAVNAIFELISFTEHNSKCPPLPSTIAGLAKVLNRTEDVIKPLPENIPRVFDRMRITDPSWRFVYSYLSMLASTPSASSLGLAKTLVAQLQKDSSAFLKEHIAHAGGSTLDSVASISVDDCLRYDAREKARRELGLGVVIESFCFLLSGNDSCVANEVLQKQWEVYIDAKDDNGRFAYIVLEAILSCARGGRCSKLVAALLPKAIEFIKSYKSGPKESLLSVALYCSSFQNAGNIELLRRSRVAGNKENPAQLCTLLDACSVGNHNAVEMILNEITNGAPPIAAVQKAVEKNFPKVIDALINDDEVTKPFLEEAGRLLSHGGFPAQEALLKDRLSTF